MFLIVKYIELKIVAFGKEKEKKLSCGFIFKIFLISLFLSLMYTYIITIFFLYLNCNSFNKKSS